MFLQSRPGRFLIVFRLGGWAKGSRSRLPLRILTRFLHRRWTVRYGFELPLPTQVGPGLKMSHLVGGIIVNQHATLGSSVTLTPGVVIGNNTGRSGAPAIGDGVTLHVGSKVIGAVTVGAGSQVGANAVVVRDVPPQSVVAGVPAKVLTGRSPHAAGNVDFVSVMGPIPA